MRLRPPPRELPALTEGETVWLTDRRIEGTV